MKVPNPLFDMSIVPIGIFIPKGIDTDLRSILLRLNDKFSTRICIFGSQDEWYTDKHFVGQKAEIAYLCEIKKWIGVRAALIKLKKAKRKKEFSLSNALMFVEKVFDNALLEKGKSLTIMLSDDVKVSESTCAILILHHLDDTWELFMYPWKAHGKFGPSCCILCK